MPTDNKYIKKQFEKSMAVYDKNATVQDLMGSKMVIELAKVSDAFDDALELGSGTGLFTKKMLKSLKIKRFYANDLVEKSKLYVQKIRPDTNFFCGNALKIKVGRRMDLIASNAMVQWFDNLEKAFEILRLSLNKGGIFAFSTFSPANFAEITKITGLALKYKSKEEIEEILEKLGFEILYSEEFFEEMSFATPLELLAHLKNTGVNSLSEKTWTVKKVKDFCDKYSKEYPKVKLTYSPIIVIAKLTK